MTPFASPALRRSDAPRPFRSAPKARAIHVESPSRGLPPQRERELAARVLAGDQGARDELVTGNLSLCHFIALRYLKWHFHDLDEHDLTQEGSLGLIEAAGRYDPATHHARFSTYATYWIHKRIREAVMNTGETVRLPIYLHERQQAPSCRAALRRSNLRWFDLASPTEDKLAELVDAEDRIRLQSAISRLKPEHRELIRWYAEDYGAPAPKGESRYSRRNRANAARQILTSIRRNLNPDGADS
jgi:RNA polymerase sigma factor (sigma-70 family)